MTVSAVWSVTAKSSIIPRAVPNLGLRVYVKEWAFLIVTRIESAVEIALWHLAHVILVQKLALIPLLTQPTEPVLTNYSFIPPDMSIRTGGPPLTGGPHVELAHSRPRLVHPGKWEGLRTQLLGQSHLDIKRNVFHGCHQKLHSG